MTTDEIRRQILESVEEPADALFDKATACYYCGDYSQAFALVQKAANQGHAQAYQSLGHLYAAGKGVEQNYPLAKTLFEKAAQAGLPHGNVYVAIACMEDKYGPVDYPKALRLLNECISSGTKSAYGPLGELYLTGKGVDRDLIKAVELFNTGVDQGDEGSMFRLAKCYRDGVGVKRDLQRALSLAKSAQELNCDGAVELVKSIEAALLHESAAVDDQTRSKKRGLFGLFFKQ